jgi:hypothetical protein
MLQLRIISNKKNDQGFLVPSKLEKLIDIDSLIIEGSDVLHRWSNSTSQYVVLGQIAGIRESGGFLKPVTYVKQTAELLENTNTIPSLEGRFIVLKISESGTVELWTDQFSRVDIYWEQKNGQLSIGTSLDLLPISKMGGELDSVGVAHALTVYGGRPARKHTIYKEVQRLGVNEGLQINKGDLKILKRPFTPVNIANYTERDLNRYSDIFLETLRSRGSECGNIVSLSSGWDSTSILAGLVHVFGRQKVRAVIGRMKYSERSGIINQFEQDRAKAMAEYFGIKLDVVDVDYRKDGPTFFSEAKSLLQSHQLANLTALGQWIIARQVAKEYKNGEVFFTGEMSDGAHNFGFSQYATVFHPSSYEFREYADKMATYLFGPTFLSNLHNGVQEKDPVWQFFKQQNVSLKFDKLAENKEEITKQFISSFYLRGGRIPLSSLDNAPLLTNHGAKIYTEESQRIYFDDIYKEINTENIYSWYLHLYNSFHWQAATVISRDYTSEAHGIKCVHPFQDAGIIAFLSAMPESFGRGLDFNSTKYPLKWMLKNRIDYPYHYQTGPHSYTYDVQEGFSLGGEILNASSLKKVFQESMRQGEFISKLNQDMFDLDYVHKITNSYLAGEELKGQALSDTIVLAMHSAVGVYGK